jgi:HNH endonuclease
MPAVTTAYVKNIIRRGFSELADRSPTREEQMGVWNHFRDCCAYCGASLRRGEKQGHIDHLLSASQGGSNALGNRVLSCASCNEKEKLDRPWEGFLRSKAASDGEYLERHGRILEWQRLHPINGGQGKSELMSFARSRADEVVAHFERAVAEVRQRASSAARE